MIDFKPLPLHLPNTRAQLSAPPANVEPPPMPDTLFTGYTGAPGFLESAVVVAVSAAAAWAGIHTALVKNQNPYLQAAGWIGGVGAGLIGLMYLGGKSGLNERVGLPVVRVSPY